MGNSIRRTKCLVFLTVGFLLQSWGQDPLLAWNFEDLLTDTRPSGVNPEFQIDDLGNFHLLYWNRTRDKLVYGFRPQDQGAWEFEWVDSTSANGFKSAMFLEEGGSLHVAYLSNIGGRAWLNYGERVGGKWIVESVPISSDLGRYGFNEEFPTYAQLSIDLAINPDGTPFISYFDGTVFESSIFYCGAAADRLANIYTDYELDMRLAFKEGGSWVINDELNIPYKGPVNCLTPDGDRFGEFNSILSFPDSSYKIITNSLHNNELMVFSGENYGSGSWEYSAIDSVSRFASTGLIAGQGEREGFDFIQVERESDSLIHMVYGVTDLYGFASPTLYIRAAPFTRRTFFYTRIKADSLGVPGYTPDFEEMVPRSSINNPNSHDGNLRSLYTLSVKDDKHIFIGHYNHAINEIIFHESTTGGDTWETDTLGGWQTNSPLQSQIYGDSLYVIFYDGLEDQLISAIRPIDTAHWVIRPIIPSRKYGNVLASSMVTEEDQARTYVAFSETVEDQLYLGTFQEASWSYEPIDHPGIEISDIWIENDSDSEPVMVYGIRDSAQLKIAYQGDDGWVCEVIETEVQVAQLQAALSADSVYVVYFDLNSQALKWAASSLTPPYTWRSGWVEPDSLPPTGESFSLEMDREGALHLSYRNVFNPLFKYAKYTPGLGTWQVDTVSSPEDYFVGENDLILLNDSSPVIVFREEISNKLFLAEQELNSPWSISSIPTPNSNFIGVSIEGVEDDQDQLWVFYSSVSTQNELKAIRKDVSGTWEEVLILNNRGQIAQNFDVHMVESEVYILGQMTAPTNSGIGVLWAEQAMVTSAPEALMDLSEFHIWPNPVVGDQLTLSFPQQIGKKSSLQIFNLEGKLVWEKEWQGISHSEFRQEEIEVDFLPEGMYVCKVQSGNQRYVEKFIRQ